MTTPRESLWGNVHPPFYNFLPSVVFTQPCLCFAAGDGERCFLRFAILPPPFLCRAPFHPSAPSISPVLISPYADLLLMFCPPLLGAFSCSLVLFLLCCCPYKGGWVCSFFYFFSFLISLSPHLYCPQCLLAAVSGVVRMPWQRRHCCAKEASTF